MTLFNIKKNGPLFLKPTVPLMKGINVRNFDNWMFLIVEASSFGWTFVMITVLDCGMSKRNGCIFRAEENGHQNRISVASWAEFKTARELAVKRANKGTRNRGTKSRKEPRNVWNSWHISLNWCFYQFFFFLSLNDCWILLNSSGTICRFDSNDYVY